MTISAPEPGDYCMTTVCRRVSANTNSIESCRAPAAVKFETWAGRPDYACREHAAELLAGFAAVLGVTPPGRPVPPLDPRD